MTTEVQLCTLKPGSAFTTPWGDYRLLYANNCRAYIEPLARRKHVIKTADGEVAEFDAPGGRQNWSPNTLVEPLSHEHVAAMGHGNYSGEALGRGGTTSPSEAPMRGSTSVIGRPAQEPKRQCDPGSKRGKMLRILTDSLTGETSIGELMKEFSFTRSAVLTYCNEMHRDYGMGYTVVGEAIRVNFLPNVQPFKQEDSKDGHSVDRGKQEDVSANQGRSAGGQKAAKVKERKVAAPGHNGRKPQNRSSLRRKGRHGRA